MITFQPPTIMIP